MTTQKFLMALATLVLLFVSQVSADVIYEADIAGNTTSQGVGASIGWDAYDHIGTDLSGSDNDPLFHAAWGRIVVGDDTNGNGVDSPAGYVMLSKQGVNRNNYTDLAIVGGGYIGDRTVDHSPPLGARMLVQLSSGWYATDLLEGSASYESTYSIEASIWRQWETDLTDGFDFSEGAFGAVGTLPGGENLILNTGVLAVDSYTDPVEDDAIDLQYFSIEGTPVSIPEPSSLGLLIMGLTVGVYGLRRFSGRFNKYP